MKVDWLCKSTMPVEEILRNIAHARSLNLPPISSRDRPPLAVVAGGPSVCAHVNELKAWPGDVWACGSAFPWCREHGIEAVYVNIDPDEIMADLAVGAKHALLATVSHPRVFEAVESAEVFELIHGDSGIIHGRSTATATPHLAIEMGYRDVSLFGCESSFAATTHAYKDEHPNGRISVECAGDAYLTTPQLVMQAEHLARVLRLPFIPGTFALRERSGGLLAAMTRDLDYDVLAGDAGACELFAPGVLPELKAA